MVSSSENTIRLVVVDDHILFAEGTVLLLSSEPFITVVATANSGSECLKIVKTEHPDVVLLDINLPDYCGTDLIEKIIAIDANVSIIMLTGQDPAGYVNASFKNGAQGFLLKDCSRTEMITAILQVSRGESYISQTMDPYLKSSITGDKITISNRNHYEDILINHLTSQEIEIIELIAQGSSNREIATELGIKNRTVDSLVNNILSKLDVKSRLEALVIYTQGKELMGNIS